MLDEVKERNEVEEEEVEEEEWLELVCRTDVEVATREVVGLPFQVGLILLGRASAFSKFKS